MMSGTPMIVSRSSVAIPLLTWCLMTWCFSETFFYSPSISEIEYVPGIDHSIAAFYPCYNQPYATEQVLLMFRQSYPTAPIYMFNDGGLPILKYVASKYHAKYFHHKHRKSSDKTVLGTHWNSSLFAKPYIHDLIFTAKDSMCDWILLLEDDVFVLRPLWTAELICDIMGRNSDPWFKSTENNGVQRYLKSQNIQTHAFNSGNGGSVLRGSFLQSLSITSADHSVDLFFHLYCGNTTGCVVASDMIVFFMVQVHNGTACTYQHYAYNWWPTNWILEPLGYVHITHGDKQYYK